MWKNTVERGRPQITIRRRALHAVYLRLYKHTHSGCVILMASPLQQWLHERALVLRYTYIACLVVYKQTHITDMTTDTGLY
jgi:hypothetical protein